MASMTDKQREELAALLRTWLVTPPEPLPNDMLSSMRRQQLRNDAHHGATALLKQLLVELGGPLW